MRQKHGQSSWSCRKPREVYDVVKEPREEVNLQVPEDMSYLDKDIVILNSRIYSGEYLWSNKLKH